jgi:hypothetical protein
MVTIANMTLDELKKFIEATIDEHITQLAGKFEIPDEPDEFDNLTWDEIRASVEQHCATSPLDAKSSLTFLHEDWDS